jgi:hypothetical protein
MTLIRLGLLEQRNKTIEPMSVKTRIIFILSPIIMQFIFFGSAYLLGLSPIFIPQWPVLLVGVAMGFYIFAATSF